MELLGTGNMLRSAEMEYISLVMQEHIARDVLDRLGELGTVQFLDLNGDLTAFKRYYTPLIRRCDELEKKLRFFEDEMKKHSIPAEKYTTTEFKAWAEAQAAAIEREHRGMSLVDFWEAVISERHRDYVAIKAERDRTAATLYNAVQRRHVIEKAADFFAIESRAAGLDTSAAAPSARGVTSDSIGLLLAAEAGRARGGARAPTAAAGAAAAEEEDDLQFKHIAGIIDTSDKGRFGRIIFRVSAGHAVVRFADIDTPLVDEKGKDHNKSVFAVFYRGRTLTTKLERICTAFSATKHDIPSFANASAVKAALDETKAVIDDSIAWLQQERSSSSSVLRHLSVVLRKWKMGIAREKAAAHTMNLFLRSPERGTVTGQGWVLKTALEGVTNAVREAHVAAAQGGRMQPYYLNVLTGNSELPAPPTHFHTNKVTRVFQGIVNTYGIPRYGEANPALFSVMTFPFLFGVMYGDIGHATLLTLFSAFLVYKEKALAKKNLGEMLIMCFKGRYMLLMMGIFSVYCGLVYNDVFALATSGFGGTRWYYPEANGTVATTAIKKSGSWADVYSFGVDPEWHAADNDLLFFNSLKMKMSVIFGITQMVFGLFLKLSNALHFKSKLDLYFVAIPQIIFMVALFGYMVFLILLKWCIDWNDPTLGRAPPSLIDTLINVVLKPGTVNDPMYDGQGGFQSFILLVVFLCVPVMLCGKPYALKRQHAKAQAHKADSETHSLLAAEQSSAASGGAAAGTGVTAAGGAKEAFTAAAAAHHGAAPASDLVERAATHPIVYPTTPGAGGSGGHGGHGDHFAFGEIFIHSAIETIEFVLGSVSNTASYLRLWALSLAHSQLATVFWERALVSTIESGSAITVFIGYAVWAAITFGVLCVMDVLECFLHALRLHWVEFQNKHFLGDGHKFMPFAYAALEAPEGTGE